MIIARSGSYDKILNYVVSVDFIFFGATAVCIFVFRRRRDGAAALLDAGASAPDGVGRIAVSQATRSRRWCSSQAVGW